MKNKILKHSTVLFAIYLLFVSINSNAGLGTYSTSDVNKTGNLGINNTVTCEPAAISAFVASLAFAAGVVTAAWNLGNSVGAALRGQAMIPVQSQPHNYNNKDFSEFDA